MQGTRGREKKNLDALKKIPLIQDPSAIALLNEGGTDVSPKINQLRRTSSQEIYIYIA